MLNKIKKIYPLSFKLNGSKGKLILNILIYVAAYILFSTIYPPIAIVLGTIAGFCMATIFLFIIGVIILIPMLIISYAIMIYIFSGMTISVLEFFKCFKDEPLIEEAVAEEIAEEIAE